MSNHSPGPWYALADGITDAAIGYRAVVDFNGDTVCNPSPMGEANARLIAAAPDMYHALQDLIAYLGVDVDNGLDELLTNARAAIATAKGQ